MFGLCIMCKEFILHKIISDSILESWPKKKKDLLDEIGIETDESVGAVFPS